MQWLQINKSTPKLKPKPSTNIFKVLFLGETGVDKTSIINVFTSKQFSNNYISTIGIDFKVKRLEINNKPLQLHLWDTAGQERFNTITSSYYRNADVIILVYSVNS